MQVKPSLGYAILTADGEEHPAIRLETDEGVYHVRVEDALVIGMLEEEDHVAYQSVMVLAQTALKTYEGLDA